jgi:hypothetical protein
VGRDGLRRRLRSKPPVPTIDPAEVLMDWPLGRFDESAAALVRSSGLATGAVAQAWQGVLTHDVVAILEPSAKRADHYRLFDGTGISIGAVVARRSRFYPHLIKDKTIQFVDCTGRAFVVDWWSSKMTTVCSGETSAVVRDAVDGRVLGRCSADDGGRWLLGDVHGQLVAYTDKRSSGLLQNPAGARLAALDVVGMRWTWPWRRQQVGYRRARVVAFDPACTRLARALALSAMMCAEVQALEDLTADFGGD